MAQSTMEKMTARARHLAATTGDEASRRLVAALPEGRMRQMVARRTGRTTLARRLMDRGTVLMAWRGRRGTTPMRVSWQLGKFTGRAQGVAWMAPKAARAWWKSAAAAASASAAGAAATNWLRRATQRGLAKSTTRGAARQAMRQTKMISRGAKTAAPATRRGWTFAQWTGRPTAMPRWAPMAATRRRVGRGWRWIRMFTLGFAVGALWAYLFAPRQGAMYAQMQRTTQPSQPVPGEAQPISQA